MNRQTLAFKFEASLHNSHSKYDIDKNLEQRACDIRRSIVLIYLFTDVFLNESGSIHDSSSLSGLSRVET